MYLKKVTSLMMIFLLISAFIIPTSAFASTSATQSNSNSGFFQTICNFFSFSNNDKNTLDYQTESYNNGGSSGNKNNDNSSQSGWDCFLNWWCYGDTGGNHHDGGGNGGGDGCCQDGGSWSNDNGCTGSDQIWKKWYGH